MSVSLRPATNEDLDQILEIEKKSFPKPWKRQNFEQEFSLPYSRFLVLTDDETDSVVAGYIVYWAQVPEFSLLNITVHPEWRGIGFGTRLMGALINEAVREEVPKVILEVRKSNTGAILLYEKTGFKKTHERASFYEDGETAVVMELKTSDVSGVIQ